jgi:Lipocalin-like domain
MNRRKAIAALSFASLVSAQSVRKQIVGVWKLVGYDWKDKATGEARHPYGEHPVGRITYDAAGRMSAQLMRPGRKTLGGPSTLGAVSAVAAASDQDLREMVSGYVAYFGTFDIDEAARTVIHHVEGALIPSWVGTDLRRAYEFTADRLILTATLDQAVIRLTWQRDGKAA